MTCKVEGSKGTICQIPAVKFDMGSERGYPDERPVRRVELSAFGMQQHPVTVRKYKTYVEDVGKFLMVASNLLKSVTEGKGSVPPITSPSMPGLPEGFGGDNQPMVNVSWQEARDYCRFYGMDLPTEAQWERAARGRFGDKEYGTKSGALNHAEAHYDARTTAPVCSKPKNDLGLCDMAGNVWEWTLDWYRDAYTMDAKDPKGPSGGRFKVIRGGSWNNSSYVALHYLQAAYRYSFHPVNRIRKVGFRCVAAPQDSKK